MNALIVVLVLTAVAGYTVSLTQTLYLNSNYRYQRVNRNRGRNA